MLLALFDGSPNGSGLPETLLPDAVLTPDTLCCDLSGLLRDSCQLPSNPEFVAPLFVLSLFILSSVSLFSAEDCEALGCGATYTLSVLAAYRVGGIRPPTTLGTYLLSVRLTAVDMRLVLALNVRLVTGASAEAELPDGNEGTGASIDGRGMESILSMSPSSLSAL